MAAAVSPPRRTAAPGHCAEREKIFYYIAAILRNAPSPPPSGSPRLFPRSASQKHPRSRAAATAAGADLSSPPPPRHRPPRSPNFDAFVFFLDGGGKTLRGVAGLCCGSRGPPAGPCPGGASRDVVGTTTTTTIIM